MTARRNTIRLSIAGDEPPTEFRIFTAGQVVTTKGTFIFDEAAAKSVMDEYLKHGIDLMIDYDHASLASIAIDPALAGKAAGWFNLEVRDGELWAVNVRWTPPAANALRAKEWRFMSPAFGATEDGRIVDLLNVAITNMPATRQLAPLMAASVNTLGAGMDPKNVMEALDALIAGDEAKCAELLKGIIAAAAGAEATEAPGEEAPAPPAGEQDMAADIPPKADPTTDSPAEQKKEEDEEDKLAVTAAASRLSRLTGQTTIAASLDVVEKWRASHAKIEKIEAEAAAERVAIEAGKRRENAIMLTKLGAETPATTGLGLPKPKLCARLATEPLDEQNARVAALLAARGGKLPAEVTPPATTDASGLTQAQLAKAKKAGVDPATFAKNLSQMSGKA